jgi:hypothetical protein
LKGPEAQRQIGALVDRVNAGTLPAMLHLDVLEVAAKDTITAHPRVLETGGSATRGRQVVSQHPAAQCMRCHSLRGSGATVGPALDGIGKRLSRAELVQRSDPSARRARATVSVPLRTAARRRAQGRDALRGRPPSPTRAIGEYPRRNRRAHSAVSAMPPMGLLLAPVSLRRVEFLTDNDRAGCRRRAAGRAAGCRPRAR